MKKVMIVLIIFLLVFTSGCGKKEQIQKTKVIYREAASDQETPTIVLKKTSEKKPAKMIKEELPEFCALKAESISEDDEIDVYFNEKRIAIIPGYLVCDAATNYLYKILTGEKEKILPCSINLPERRSDLIKFLADNNLVKDQSERCLYGCMKGVTPGRCNPQPASALKNIRGESYIGR